MEEDIEELLKCKDDYDFAYGTQIHRPYVMSEKDWELIENLLTRYKEIKTEHRIMKRILVEHNLWETLLNDDEFIKHLEEE